MTKINNQSNFLDSIEFVQDISAETAAIYSGGGIPATAAAARFDSNAIGSEIILHKDPNGQGQALGLSSNSGISGLFINIGLLPEGGETTFNDTVSSITVNSGTWRFFTDDDGGGDTGFLAPGTHNLGANDDAITSIRHIGS